MNSEKNHLLDVLEMINNLQRNTLIIDKDINNSCLKPILGQSNNIIVNTRPVTFYLCNNETLSINLENNEIEQATNIFRIEDVKGNLITLRLLVIQDDGTITSTDEFATISINCIAALRCLQDVSLSF